MFSSLNESWASLIATKVRTLNVMSIESMTLLILLMDVQYIAIYIRNKMSFVYIRKIIFLYFIYCCYSFAWFRHGGYYLPQKGQRMHACMTCMCILRIAIWHWVPRQRIVFPAGRGLYLHSPENFCTLLPIPTLLKFSIKTMSCFVLKRQIRI